MKRNKLLLSLIGCLLFFLAISLGRCTNIRIDLTEDKRYTLTDAAAEVVREINGPVSIDVLLGGELPPEFAKLRLETVQILKEYAAENDALTYQVVDPLEDQENNDSVIAELQAFGLTPANITTEENAKISQEIFFPWAIVSANNKVIKVPLLRNKLGATMEDRVTLSVQNLEYAFADAFSKLIVKDKKKIAVIKGNGELEDIYLANFLTDLKDYYNLGAITLDSAETNAQKVFDQLKTYDLAIIAKPTEPFSETEKYLLDQYIVQGGKSIWLLDPVIMELDSLFNETGSSMAFPRELNLNDIFFKYGFRLNPDLVNDMYFTQVVLATGDGNNTQYNPVPWTYNPMVFSPENHPINKNLEALRFQFTSSIDTLANSYKKTVLLASSPLSKVDGTPKIINLNRISEPLEKESFNNGNKILSVLIEGEFSSAFENRVLPISLKGSSLKGEENKMLIISDGDLIKNQIRNNLPLELGYDKWTNNYYGNKDFLINSVNYLLDDSGLINIRNKKVKIPLLDPEKIVEQKIKWQLVNIGVPLALLFIFGFVFIYKRKQKYSA